MAEENIVKDEDYLNSNQQLRQKLINQMTTDSEGNECLPTDKDSINSLDKLMNGIDRSIYTKRRVMVEEEGAENDKRAAELIELALGKLSSGGRDSKSKEVGSGPLIDDSRLPVFEVTDESMSEVGGEVDLDQITAEGRRITKGV